jgi:hypothetical protein
MKRKLTAVFVILLAALAAAIPVLAAAPASGAVTEGVSAPGVNLGDSRAQVEAAYGAPSFCQSVETAGDAASCSFPVEGGGQVDIRYRGAGGGNASNSPDDVVHSVRWHEAVSGWTTTAGVNTTLAKADPDAVIAAYPDAQVTYNMFGDIYSLRDAELGIEVIWALDFYSGTVHVSMAIFAPQPPPPPPPPQPEQTTRVVNIDLTAVKVKKQREITALVQVRNEDDLAAAGAAVTATWTLPNGSEQTVQDTTSGAGIAAFELNGRLPRGTYTLTINDVTLADHDFDEAGSVLSASVKAK